MFLIKKNVFLITALVKDGVKQYLENILRKSSFLNCQYKIYWTLSLHLSPTSFSLPQEPPGYSRTAYMEPTIRSQTNKKGNWPVTVLLYSSHCLSLSLRPSHLQRRETVLNKAIF